MKRLNSYYLISIISLAFMFLILMKTLQTIGWFDEREQPNLIKLVEAYTGTYSVVIPDSLNSAPPIEVSIEVQNQLTRAEILQGDHRLFDLVISEFEDEQLLVEIFKPDSSGESQKFEACELLLTVEEAEQWRGSTLGEFCKYDETLETYIAMSFHGDMMESILILETRRFEDNQLIQKKEYRLQRMVRDE